jgi:hypothetical protein
MFVDPLVMVRDPERESDQVAFNLRTYAMATRSIAAPLADEDRDIAPPVAVRRPP